MPVRVAVGDRVYWGTGEWTVIAHSLYRGGGGMVTLRSDDGVEALARLVSVARVPAAAGKG